MGVRTRLAQAAARRPHVLLVAAPGAAPVRWAAEDALDARGWPRASSPAAADALLLCGPAGPQLSACVDVVWEELPGPRARGTAAAAAVDAVLDGLQVALRDVDGQRRDARERSAPALSASDADSDDGDMDMGHDMDMDHDMDMGGMDHSMHGGGMAMSLPGGLQMADRVADRDGLRLEGLHLALGPVLPAWPAGLRLHAVLSGDVLVEASVEQLDPAAEPPAPQAVSALDQLAGLLAASGWEDGARRARRARAEGGDGPRTRDLLHRLGRARLLRWSLRGLPGPGEGDLGAHLDRLVAAVTGDAELPSVSADRLAAAVTGLELGSAALVVAACGPLLEERVHA